MLFHEIVKNLVKNQWELEQLSIIMFELLYSMEIQIAMYKIELPWFLCVIKMLLLYVSIYFVSFSKIVIMLCGSSL